MTEPTSFFGPFWIGRVKRSPSHVIKWFFSLENRIYIYILFLFENYYFKIMFVLKHVICVFCIR